MRAQRKHALALGQSPLQVLFPHQGDRRDDPLLGQMHRGAGLQHAARKILPRAPDQSSSVGWIADLGAEGLPDVFFHPASILPKNAEARSRAKKAEENEQTIRDPWHDGDKAA